MPFSKIVLYLLLIYPGCGYLKCHIATSQSRNLEIPKKRCILLAPLALLLSADKVFKMKLLVMYHHYSWTCIWVFVNRKVVTYLSMYVKLFEAGVKALMCISFSVSSNSNFMHISWIPNVMFLFWGSICTYVAMNVCIYIRVIS